ncbi:MAG TPA: hypothetical protein VFR63_00890 [Gaiellaceae bacterium]|nr:hypothetical protein [Gaiellaceae bacterium]
MPIRTFQRCGTIEPPNERRLGMYGDHMDGWDWVWGTLMMGFWVVLLAVIVYVAVRLAQRDGHKTDMNPRT